MAIKYQEGFIGAQTVSKDSGAQDLVNALDRFAIGFDQFGKAMGKKITKKTTAEAEKAARLDNLKSYQDAVDKGELDGTQSEFWISVYDNIKGQNAGAEYKTKKALAYNEWWASNVENDDLDGSLYTKWSSEFDSKYIEANKDKSNYYLKGLEGFILSTNQQMAGMYAQSNATKLKTKGKNNLIESLESVIGTDEVKAKIAELDVKTNVSRFLNKEEFNGAVIQAYKNKIAKLALKGDPSADYDEAEALIEELINFKRANGSKIVNGKAVAELENLKQTIASESIQHQMLMKKVSETVVVQDWFKQEEHTLSKIIGYDFATGSGEKEAMQIANYAKDEYSKRVKAWMKINKDKPVEFQKAYLTELRQDIVNKYDQVSIDQLSLYNRASNKFNVLRLDATINAAIATYDINPEDPELMAAFGVIAKLNGFVNEKGEVTSKEIGDLLVAISKSQDK